MAQLVARMHGVHEAVGSSPATPTKDFNDIRRRKCTPGVFFGQEKTQVRCTWDSVVGYDLGGVAARDLRNSGSSQ